MPPVLCSMALPCSALLPGWCGLCSPEGNLPTWRPGPVSGCPANSWDMASQTRATPFHTASCSWLSPYRTRSPGAEGSALFCHVMGGEHAQQMPRMSGRRRPFSPSESASRNLTLARCSPASNPRGRRERDESPCSSLLCCPPSPGLGQAWEGGRAMKSACDFKSENLRPGSVHLPRGSLAQTLPSAPPPHHMTCCTAQPIPATYIWVTYRIIIKIKKYSQPSHIFIS